MQTSNDRQRSLKMTHFHQGKKVAEVDRCIFTPKSESHLIIFKFYLLFRRIYIFLVRLNQGSAISLGVGMGMKVKSSPDLRYSKVKIVFMCVYVSYNF